MGRIRKRKILRGGRTPYSGDEAYQHLQREYEARVSLDELESTVSELGVVPLKGIIHAYLTAAELATNFSSGLGVIRTDYEGWAICDGSNGTPNLASKFVRSQTTGAGTTGGSDSSAHTHAIDHDHGSFTSGATTLTSGEIPAHTHSLGIVPEFVGGGTGAYNVTTNAVAPLNWQDRTATGSTGSGGSHTHAVDVPALTGTSGAASATENRPAYYELVPLMWVGF